MALPLSRNTTYVASDPPKANDLDAIQDCIIGGKFGATSLTLFGGALQPSGSVPPTLFSTGQWSFTGSGLLQCWLPLTPGTVIGTVYFSYTRPSGNLGFLIGQRNIAWSDVAWVDTVISSGATTMTTVSYAVNQAISAEWGAFFTVNGVAGHVFYGARMTISKP